MLKILILCVGLISHPMDFHVSSSVGFTQKHTYAGDYWSDIDKKRGFNYRIFVDGYLNNYFGVGIEVCVNRLYGIENMIDEEDSIGMILSPYLIAELPLMSNISLLAQVGFGTIIVIPPYTLNYGMRLQMDITRKFKIGLMFDEKLEGAILSDYGAYFHYFLLRSYSIYIGYDL